MTKRFGAKQECGASTHIEETLLDLVRWHDSHTNCSSTSVRVLALPVHIHWENPTFVVHILNRFAFDRLNLPSKALRRRSILCQTQHIVDRQ